MKLRKDLGMRIPVKIFVQDPFIAKKYKKEKKFGIETIELDWEPSWGHGPTSSRVAVVDYNMDTDILASPVEWDIRKKKFGVTNPNSFLFHQLNVWATIQNILAFFEKPQVMGRPIPWGFNGNKLIVVPHAGEMQNAFYSRRGKCLLFYYFFCEGVPVYTCLSHDIVAHETGHAILDGIRPHYFHFSSAQTGGFHEFIADLTAIFALLRTNKVRHSVAEIVEKNDGKLWKAKVISGLGEEFAVKGSKATFGKADRNYIRNAYNKKTMDKIKNCWIPHYCSEVLTGALFEILAKITSYRIKKENETAKDALWNATEHVNKLAFRALDYCPPVDIQYADYVQALIRADEIAYPTDKHGYLKIIKKIFKKRGIEKIDPTPPPKAVTFTWKYDLERIASSHTTAYHFLDDNRKKLKIPKNQDFEIADIYYTDKVVGAHERLPREIILEYIWSEPVILEGEEFGELKNKKVPLRCGGTLVFEERGNILYWSRKASSVEKEGNERIKNLLHYIKLLIAADKIKLVSREALQYINPYQPAIEAIQDGDMVQLEMTPEFLNPTIGFGEK